MTDLADFGLIYDQKRRAAAQQRDALLASNAFSRTLIQNRGQRDLVDFNQRWTQGLEGFGAGFARRGLGRSGLFRRAQNQYASDWASQRNSMLDAMNQKLNDLSFSDAQGQAQYNQTSSDLEYQKMQDILATAQALRGYRRVGG